MKQIVQFAAGLFLTATVLTSCGSGDGISEQKLLPVRNGKEYQYINRKGEIVINPQFAQASIFREGLALVQLSGNEPKWGFIDEDGKYVINAQYKSATIFREGLAWVVKPNEAPTAIDTKGEVKFTLQEAEFVCIFREGLAAFCIVGEEGNHKWGFVNKRGEIIINPQFSQVANFGDGLCAVRNDDRKWGYIDKEGKIIINYQFDHAQSFEKGKAIVKLGDKAGVIDKTGKYILNPQFDELRIDGNWFQVEQNGKYGWCDKDGKLIINPQFDNAYLFNENKLAAVKSGENYGYIDKKGKYVINPQFDHAYSFNSNLALVENAGKTGLIDRKGKYVVNPQFDDFSWDLIFYINSGSSFHGHGYVTTDYFNINAVVSAINFDAPEGFTAISTFGDIKKKYDLEDSKFNKYGTDNEVVKNKSITNDASYSFHAIGKAFDQKQVRQGSGWYSYYTTKYDFNGERKPVSYSYEIYLSGNGAGKEDLLLSTIESKLSGYTKIENARNKDITDYSDDQKIISLSKTRKGISLSFKYLAE
ncbi:MAG: WG repeat-containing protein [Bacteroidales bacterium]|jgi:hypothetical protein|nr:WG repeat-containing protein [Bacteroidales bacterium]